MLGKARLGDQRERKKKLGSRRLASFSQRLEQGSTRFLFLVPTSHLPTLPPLLPLPPPTNPPSHTPRARPDTPPASTLPRPDQKQQQQPGAQRQRASANVPRSYPQFLTGSIRRDSDGGAATKYFGCATPTPNSQPSQTVSPDLDRLLPLFSSYFLNPPPNPIRNIQSTIDTTAAINELRHGYLNPSRLLKAPTDGRHHVAKAEAAAAPAAG